MDHTLELYLAAVERHLAPLPASDRADIVQEIKSDMLDLQNQKGLSPQEITQRLGDPKALARAYLQEVIAQSKPFSWKRVAALAAFYGAAGLGGVFLLPIGGFLGLLLVFIGGTMVFASGLSVLQAIAHALGLMSTVYYHIGGPFPAWAVILVVFLIGLVFFALGCGCFSLIVLYIRAVGKGTNKFRQA